MTFIQAIIKHLGRNIPEGIILRWHAIYSKTLIFFLLQVLQIKQLFSNMTGLVFFFFLFVKAALGCSCKPDGYFIELDITSSLTQNVCDFAVRGDFLKEECWRVRLVDLPQRKENAVVIKINPTNCVQATQTESPDLQHQQQTFQVLTLLLRIYFSVLHQVCAGLSFE